MAEATRVLKAFAEGARLHILRLTSKAELRVSEVVGALEVPQWSISPHLPALKRAGPVKDRPEGTWVYCQMASAGAVAGPLWQAIRPQVDASSLGVREMGRAVKRGGKVVITDLVKHDFDWTRELIADVWLGFTEEQVRDWLREAGLVDSTYSSAAVPLLLEEDGSARLRGFVATGAKPSESRA